ncbi:MAG: M28 family peptidase [Deltaproteobacteria bacterium]|nr:M28 family peptidase [Deltaproteobacteria bacterium]
MRANASDALVAEIARSISAEQIGFDVTRVAGFETRHTLSTTGREGRRGIEAARLWLQAELERFGGGAETWRVETQRFRAEPSPRLPDGAEVRNVYAVSAGADPAQAHRVYLVVAHYDSRNSDVLDAERDSPGANDDGSGVAVCLACARALSSYRFPATVAFLLVSGEEQARLGSRYFARWAKNLGWHIEGVLSNDVVGGDRHGGGAAQRSVRVFSEGLPSTADGEEVRRIRAVGAEGESPSRQLARYVQEVSERVLPEGLACRLVLRPDRYRRGGDHSSFNAEGFAAVRFTEAREEFRHQHQSVRVEDGLEFGDLAKFVDPGYVAGVARLNAAALACLASSPAPPVRVRLRADELENDSTLVWEEQPGSAASEFEVLWRATTAERWQHSQRVGRALRATLPVVKDDVFFAVRACDREGRRSLAVAPQP